MTSYGRRRRRAIVTDIEQAEKGDVLSMTMLSKSLLIRPRNRAATTEEFSDHSIHPANFSIPSTKTEESSISPTVSSTKNAKQKVNSRWQTKQSKSQSIILNERQKASFDSSLPYLKMTFTDKDYVCFEHLNLFIIGMVAFCIQGFFFSLLFYIIIRIKLGNCRDRSLSSHMPMCNNQWYRTDNSYNFMR